MSLGSIRLYLNDCVQYLLFLHRKCISDKQWGRCIFPLKKEDNYTSVNILANGPSLNEELKEVLSHKERINSVCNYAAFSDYFHKLKPSVYFLADPSFFKKIESNEKIRNLVIQLNRTVNWEMTVVVPINGYKIAVSKIENKNIKIVPVPYVQYGGNERKRMNLIREGKCAPSFVNVTIFAEYFFLNMGYKYLYLYGVDHSFFEGMYVNSQNQICLDDIHFYGKEPIVIKRYKSDGTQWKLSDWIRDKYLTFLEHERMQEYAEYIGAKIINCTKKSMIDAYISEEQLKNN